MVLQIHTVCRLDLCSISGLVLRSQEMSRRHSYPQMSMDYLAENIFQHFEITGMRECSITTCTRERFYLDPMHVFFSMHIEAVLLRD